MNVLIDTIVLRILKYVQMRWNTLGYGFIVYTW